MVKNNIGARLRLPKESSMYVNLKILHLASQSTHLKERRIPAHLLFTGFFLPNCTVFSFVSCFELHRNLFAFTEQCASLAPKM